MSTDNTETIRMAAFITSTEMRLLPARERSEFAERRPEEVGVTINISLTARDADEVQQRAALHVLLPGQSAEQRLRDLAAEAAKQLPLILRRWADELEQAEGKT